MTMNKFDIHQYFLRVITVIVTFWLFAVFSFSLKAEQALASQLISRPNIVLLVTDDQGYGDLGIHGSPVLKTPNIDAFAKKSVRLNNFHVDPTCSPTRAALLTGKGSLKAGVWHTVLGRYMLGPEHELLSEVLKKHGYDTSIFGKWHLGDNYPYRPQEQGFDEVYIHGGGGIGQTPDYWGNTQFDDTYYRNGKEEKAKGYASKVWFDNAINFIEKKRTKPFFTYLALNAPHGPYRAPEQYITPYLALGLDRKSASLFAMITHLDRQMKRLRDAIKSIGQEDNTIFIFMSDNGSTYSPTNAKGELKVKKNPFLASAAKNYPDWVPNGGMQGYKASVYEGGHRVPFFISYPNGHLKTGEYNQLTAHFDIMPTLLDLAEINIKQMQFDGKSLKTLMTKGKDKTLENRSIVITNQRVYHPDINRPTVVAQGKWRYLVENQKAYLFDVEKDRLQQHNVIEEFPSVAKALKAKRQAWWDENVKLGFKDRYIHVGNKAENPVRLNAMDWMEVPEKQPVPWFIGHQAPVEETNQKVFWITQEDKYSALPWYIDVEKSGQYQIKAYLHDKQAATPVGKKYCVINANGKKYTQKVWGRASHCVANIRLTEGKQKLTAWFTDDKTIDKKDGGGMDKTSDLAAFYVYVELDRVDL